MLEDYLRIFIDSEYPVFIDKYLNTKTLKRLKFVTQFCGSDYTKLYSPLFLYTRFDHSLVVAHMTWHFTHDKKETIAALLHDVGTPCFAHCIDFVFGDYMKQESSERNVIEIIKLDEELLGYLQEDDVLLEDLKVLENYPILENKSPQLCTDRLDGVFHTCYVWLHTHFLSQIERIYDDITVLENESKCKEIGFKNINIAEDFLDMVFVYAKELQSNQDKYVMRYIAEIVKLAFEHRLITLDDLYQMKEQDIISILDKNFSTWKSFEQATNILRTEEEPNHFYVSFHAKKRNVIPLVSICGVSNRLIEVSNKARQIYCEYENYSDTKFAYVKTIKKLK